MPEATVALQRGTPDYPNALERLPDPPASLRLRGRLPPLARAVAIVGTRRPTERGAHLARRWASELAEGGCVIVSGGAVGIDHAAHIGALDVRGTSVVVHASGLLAPYPAAHEPLYRAIVERGGAELSEYADDEPPRRHTFLARNRIIAGLARAVLVLEAPHRSGALSTASHARSIGVPLLAAPRVPEVAQALGSNELIRRGAIPCLSPRDVLDVIEGLPFVASRAALPPREDRERTNTRTSASASASASEVGSRAPSSSLSPRLREILALMEAGTLDPDTLVEALGRAVSEVLGDLVELELRGLICPTRDGRFELLG